MDFPQKNKINNKWLTLSVLSSTTTVRFSSRNACFIQKAADDPVKPPPIISILISPFLYRFFKINDEIIPHSASGEAHNRVHRDTYRPVGFYVEMHHTLP